MEIHIVCPHCQLPVLIMRNEINCAIFRHGIFKKSGKQMDPHTSKDLCDFLVKQNYIYGCGKPFQLVIRRIDNNDKFFALPCDYI